MREEGILVVNGNDFYPYAHSDNNKEVITDTYARKEINNFAIRGGNYWEESISPVGDIYYKYVIEPNEDEIEEEYKYLDVINVKETDNPIWDICVDPSDEEEVLLYKQQIKYRAWITTLLTENGRMILFSLKQPEENVKLTLTTVGLRLHPGEY